jgi:rod shape-determining protein MreD
MWWLLPLLVITVIVQALAFPGLITNGIRPDLSLVIVLGWASIRGWEQAVVAALVAGFVTDLISAAPFGVNMLRLAALAWIVGIGTERLQRTSPVLPVFAAGVGSLIGYLLDAISLQAAGWAVSWEQSLLFAVLPSAALTVICMAAVAPGLRALAQATSGESEETRIS